MTETKQQDSHVGGGPARSSYSFPVVALGASAGGLEALQQVFSKVSRKSGMAFVVIQHLDPERPSMLTKVLEGKTQLAVVEAKSGMPLCADRVHVIPSGSDLAVRDGILTLLPRQKTGVLHLPIDSFFRSLAADAKDRAIGVVLSGSGADGTNGLEAIKAEGGIAIAQDPSTASFSSMPESAIASGVVDFCGSPEAIARDLANLSRHPYIASHEDSEAIAPEAGDTTVTQILTALRKQVGVDFSGYKQTTIQRRIERRMALRHVRDIGEYASLVDGNTEEARLLCKDMLIHVTSFFRDPAAFAALEHQVLEPLVKRKNNGDSLRIWSPGCATGEEVYGIVMCLIEAMDEHPKDLAIKIFGTDLSEEAIEIARTALYPESAMATVSSERLDRFFERVHGGYRISRAVRDLCVFVKHDLTSDPPFANLDLISCRNVLIYFDADLQRTVIPLLHYCLAPGGFLFLGQSETITGFRELFGTVDKDHRIFVKTGNSSHLLPTLRASRDPERQSSASRRPERQQSMREIQRQADHLMLTRYAPPGVIVNSRFDIVQFRGRTGLYLEPPPGQPQANLMRMARAGLAAHLHEALEKARAEVVTTRKTGLQFPIGAEVQAVDLEVVPLAGGESSDQHFLVLFEPTDRANWSAAASTGSAAAADEEGWESERIKAELQATKDYLQSLISDHQSTTDELASANEELVAANEELQSINEELQSAKEELQSTNEELSTVNDQLRHRNIELDQVANDLVNVLASVEIPVIIVDLDLCVRRYTPTVGDIARFIPEDVGRPIEDLKLRLNVDDLASRIRLVLDGLTPREWEVQGDDGRWYQMQIRPYRTADNRLDGAVLSFVDVNILRRAIDDAEGARDYARSIVETVGSSLVVLDAELRLVSANAAFHTSFVLGHEKVEDNYLAEICGGVWKVPSLQDALNRAVRERKGFAAMDIQVDLPGIGHRELSLSGRPILWGDSDPLVLLAIDDVTSLRTLESERTQLLASEKQARVEAERATRAKDLFLATLSHELRTPLSSILMSAQLLRMQAKSNPDIERPSAAIERAASAQARLIDDLLDVSRIVSGKLMLDLGPVDFEDVVREAVELNRPSALAKGVQLNLTVESPHAVVYGDQARLLQVVNNLLTNAVKFTPHGERIDVLLGSEDARIELTVTDTGMGIRPDILPNLFARFVQADSSVTRNHGGLGLGLSIVRHLVDVHGGQVHVESSGEGKGSTFRITLPAGSSATASPAVRRTAVESVEGLRVLLVEDDDDTRDAYAEMLAALGIEVQAEPSATQALAALRSFHPDVILSDIAMPGGDGFSFMQQVRQLPPGEGGRTPAAALTALASSTDRQRALKAGYQLHVPKPVDSARLESVVAVLSHWNAHQDLFTGAGAGSSEDSGPGQDAHIEDSAEPSWRVLVVEDDELIAATLPKLLENAGHEARCARSGQSAVEMGKTFVPDVVLIDLGLPDMDGYQVAQTLRNERNGHPMLLVALSGSEPDREMLDRAGFDQYLLKPVGIETLTTLLAGWPASQAN